MKFLSYSGTQRKGLSRARSKDGLSGHYASLSGLRQLSSNYLALHTLLALTGTITHKAVGR